MPELLKQTHSYRVGTEEEATDLIESEKTKAGLLTYKTSYKTKTVKGEVIDSWYVVDITHDYTK